MTKDELNNILESHSQWVEGERAGKRANLQGANLQGEDLQGADLRMANLLVCQAEDITAYIQKGISQIGRQRLPNTTIRAMSADDWEAIEEGAGELWGRYGPVVLAAIDAVEADTAA